CRSFAWHRTPRQSRRHGTRRCCRRRRRLAHRSPQRPRPRPLRRRAVPGAHAVRATHERNPYHRARRRTPRRVKMPHLIQRVAILGTGLIGGSFAKRLREYTPDMHIVGWDREEVAHQMKSSGAANQTFSGTIEPAIRGADLIYIALPIGVTLDILSEVAQNAAPHALVTDACSTKLRICTAAVELFEEEESSPIFLGGHP